MAAPSSPVILWRHASSSAMVSRACCSRWATSVPLPAPSRRPQATERCAHGSARLRARVAADFSLNRVHQRLLGAIDRLL